MRPRTAILKLGVLQKKLELACRRIEITTDLEGAVGKTRKKRAATLLVEALREADGVYRGLPGEPRTETAPPPGSIDIIGPLPPWGFKPAGSVDLPKSIRKHLDVVAALQAKLSAGQAATAIHKRLRETYDGLVTEVRLACVPKSDRRGPI